MNDHPVPIPKSNTVPPGPDTVTQPATIQKPNPRSRRRLFLYVAFSALGTVILLQSAIIVYLLSGVTRQASDVLSELGMSPLFQELRSLNLQARPGNRGSSQAAPQADPDTYYLPPNWDGGILPDDPKSAPGGPWADPRNDLSTADVLDLLEGFGTMLDEELRRLEDPSYRGNPDHDANRPLRHNNAGPTVQESTPRGTPVAFT